MEKILMINLSFVIFIKKENDLNNNTNHFKIKMILIIILMIINRKLIERDNKEGILINQIYMNTLLSECYEGIIIYISVY